MNNLGRTAGGMSALSTAGSSVGTGVTGFILIGLLGVSRIFLLAGLLLRVLGVIYLFVFRRHRVSALFMLFLLLGISLVPVGALPSRLLADGTRATVIEKRASFDGNLRVVDYQFGSQHIRELAIEGLIQGGGEVATGLSIYEYDCPM